MVSFIMNKITLFFLLFSVFPTFLFSKDITSARIDGFYLTESLLNYYTEEKIKNAYNYDYLPSDMKFRISEIEANESSSYDVYQFYHMPNDKRYVIHGIRAAKFCENKKECEKEFNETQDYLSNIFINVEKLGPFTDSHIDDPSGKSKYTIIEYILSDGNANVTYTNWSNEVIYDDSVSVTVSSNDVVEWINSDYGMN